MIWTLARWQSVERILFLSAGGILLAMVVGLFTSSSEGDSEAPALSAPTETVVPLHPLAEEDRMKAELPSGVQVGVGLAFLLGLSLLLLEGGRILRDSSWRHPPPMPWHASLIDVGKLIVVVLALQQIVVLVAHRVAPDLAPTSGAPFYWVTALLLGYAGILLASKPLGTAAFGLDPRRLARDGIMALRAYAAFIPILMGSMLLAYAIWQAWLAPDGSGPVPPQQVPVTTMTDPAVPLGERIYMMVYAVTGAAFLEEVFFRGFLYTAIRKNLHWVGSAILCGIVFGLVHGSSYHAMPLAVFGIYLCLLREFTGSLTVPILVHGLHNGVQLLLLHSLGGGGAS